MLKLLRSFNRVFLIGLIAAILVPFTCKQLVSMRLGVSPFNAESGILSNNRPHHTGGRTMISQIYSQAQETTPKNRKSNSNVSTAINLKTPTTPNQAVICEAFNSRVLEDSPSSSTFSLRI
ncbi:MAG TPA: hypothetical protein VIJ93_12850 [bacterium]